MRFSEDEMYRAVLDCDEGYDGEFFYVVKTVGVYCRPSCKSRSPLQKNVCYYESAEQAQSAGFRPCKRCSPDLAGAPAGDAAALAKGLMDRYFGERERLDWEMKRLGVCSGHLAAVFKRRYGIAPSRYLSGVRIEHAKKMLEETDAPVIQISGDVGFDSLPSFYGFFKRHTGGTPGAYRAHRAHSDRSI